MKYFVFENLGVIDPRSITTFGVSSKDDTAKAVGFFGTGLKYAIAILLRNNCGITIYSGGKKYVFGVFREKIRNDEFNIITMNNVKLGFTTELGKTWEVWQALRELHCNCVDETGTSCETKVLDTSSKNSTLVVVQGINFENAWRERRKIFLASKPFHMHEQVNVHSDPSDYVYYRGIRTHKLSRASRYTYDIQHKMELTEDRTFKYDWYVNTHIAEMLIDCTDERLIEQAITEPSGGYWESSLSFAAHPFGEVFEKVAVRLIKDFRPNINQSVTRQLRQASFDKIVSDDTDKMSKLDKQRLEKSLAFLKKIGHDCSQYPIVVSENLGESTLGRAYEDKIYLAQRVFMMGTKMVAGTILEEYLHLKHGFADCDRPLQNWLFDALISMGEQATGECL